MKILLIIATLTSSAGAATLLITLPLSTQQMVALAMLAVGLSSAVMAIIRAEQDSQQTKNERSATNQNLAHIEKIMGQHNEELQTYLTNFESFIKVENEAIIKKLTSTSAETTDVASKVASANSSIEASLHNHGQNIAQLEKSTKNIGILLTAFSKAQDNFRSKTNSAMENISGAATSQAEELDKGINKLNKLSTTTSNEFDIQKKAGKALLTMLKDSTAALKNLQQECESEFEQQNSSRDSLFALLSENINNLNTLQENSKTEFSEQKEASTEQQKCLNKIEKNQLNELVNIGQAMTKLGDETTATIEAINQLHKSNSSDWEAQQMAYEMLAQLVTDNDTNINKLHTINNEGFTDQQKLTDSLLGKLNETATMVADIKDENNQELANQAEVLSELNSKVGSQQNALVAALRQVENSHRPQGRIEGDLSNLGLPDLLQIMQLAKKTASIILKDINGALYLEKGMLVYVHQGKFAGIQAFIRIMMLIRGYFSVRFDTLPSSLPKKPRPLIPELLTVLAEVDEIKEEIANLNKKISKESKLDDFLVQLPSEGIDPAILQTFNYQAPASLEELAVMMGKEVMENISILEELYDSEKLTLIS